MGKKSSKYGRDHFVVTKLRFAENTLYGAVFGADITEAPQKLTGPK